MTDSDDNGQQIIIPTPGGHGMSELLRKGIFFTLGGAATGLYTGDLFYNVAVQKFRISGIPTGSRSLTHVLKPEEKGPMLIHLYIERPLGVTQEGNYSSIEFVEAKVAGEFMAWLEEWYSGWSCVDIAQRNWEVAKGTLAWTR